MSQLELLSLVVSILRKLDVPLMLVGSYASSYHGESRSTHDIDLVIDLPEEKISALVAGFDRDRYYLSESAIREGRMANVIDTLTGDKVDLFFLSQDEDSQREFQRRQLGEVMGICVEIATAEDVILSKLRWDNQLGGSDQQRRDVRNIIKIVGDQLDFGYIKQHAQSTLQTFESLLDEVNPDAEP
ncbi:MAG: hypothetical protein KDB00_15710 [Planctomycetales bacterium]|nr:hypothetical protein [Planctomycetales bacterium]